MKGMENTWVKYEWMHMNDEFERRIFKLKREQKVLIMFLLDVINVFYIWE